MIAEIISRRVTRYVCAYCSRGHSSHAAAKAHVQRCFKNPAARACKTCACFQPQENIDGAYPGCGEECHAGVDISLGLVGGCKSYEPMEAAE